MRSQSSYFFKSGFLPATCKWGILCILFLLGSWNVQGEDFTSETLDVEIADSVEWPQGFIIFEV
jgi:hypothetical protein